MPDQLLQEYLFQRIKEMLPPTTALADAIAATLKINTDSARLRIQGHIPLQLEEARTLCSQYQISLDQMLRPHSGMVPFQVVQVNNTDYNFDRYWTIVLQQLQAVAAFKEKQIIYMPKDMPFFYNFCYRPLFAFRHFFWMKSILQHPDFVLKKFSMDCLSPEMEYTGKEILQLYNSIPSTEIWNTESINSTLLQIEYYREAGHFASEADVNLIYDALQKLLEHLQHQAACGCKFMPGESPSNKKAAFNLFYNRVVLGDNAIMILHDGAKTLYLNYDVLNYMYTNDAALCNEVYQQMQKLMRRATILSNVSEKQRYAFFNTLLRKIPKGAKTINTIVK